MNKETEKTEKVFGTRAENSEFRTGNSQLLMDYRDAIIKAFKLGNDIKETYGIVPPKVLHGHWNDNTENNPYTISLVVS